MFLSRDCAVFLWKSVRCETVSNFYRSWQCCIASIHCITVYIVFLICLPCLCDCEGLFQYKYWASQLVAYGNSLDYQTKHMHIICLFLQCISIAYYAEHCAGYDKAICLSVTAWYCVKMTQVMIMRSSLEDSHMTVVSWWSTSPQISKGNIGREWGCWMSEG